MSNEYVVKREDSPSTAKVFENQKEAAVLRSEGGGRFELISSGRQAWMLTNKVDGEVRPFSMLVSSKTSPAGKSEENQVLKIKDHLFYHNGKFYMFGNIPEGRPYREFLTGSRFVTRLINFPFSNLEEVDHETKSKLRRFRGLSVGEMYGTGFSGFHIKLESELDDIGLPLAASSYLIYSTA